MFGLADKRGSEKDSYKPYSADVYLFDANAVNMSKIPLLK